MVFTVVIRRFFLHFDKCVLHRHLAHCADSVSSIEVRWLIARIEPNQVYNGNNNTLELVSIKVCYYGVSCHVSADVGHVATWSECGHNNNNKKCLNRICFSVNSNNFMLRIY